jgi:hypothetical protein
VPVQSRKITDAVKSPHRNAGEGILAVPIIFNTIEESGLSTWLRESDSFFGFYTILVFHAIGMIMLAGLSTVIDLRLLGVAPAIPLAPLKQWFKVMWLGFWINAASGVLLVIAYPTKAFTNWDFYLKLTLIALGLVVMQKIRTTVFSDLNLSEAAILAKGRTLAIVSLVIWTGVVTAGRFLAYTYIYLTYGRQG